MSPRFEIEGVIGLDQATPSALGRFLSDNPGPVTLSINSAGGDAMAGAAMMAQIERHSRVSVQVQGIAASAATLLVVAGHEVVVHQAAMLMIHEPYALADGTAEAHRLAADALDKMSRTYAEAYARHTGHSVDRILAWMRAETWMTAQEAVELRFADRIEMQAAPPAMAAFDYTRFRAAPAELVQAAHKNGWAAGTPDSQTKENHHA